MKNLHRQKVWIGLAVFLILGGYRQATAQLLMYGIDLKKNKFVRVNIATTGVEVLGTPSPDLDYEAMAFDPSTSLIFLTADNDATLRKVIRNDLDIADPVPVNLAGNLPNSDIESLSVNPVTGDLYGVDNGAKKLVKINKLTGAVSVVSPSAQANLAVTEGLAFTITIPPQLYAVAKPDGQNRLVKVDYITGTASLVHPTNTLGFNGKIKALAFAPGADIFTPGTLYGFHDETHEFITIDLTTGVGSSFSVIDVTHHRNIEGLTFLKPDKLIPVELSQFAAKVSGTTVILTWVTQSETENLGFHVYRSRRRQDGYLKINSQLIAGQGSTASAHVYQFEDTSVQQGKTYFYKIADVDFNGVQTFHGPVLVTISELPRSFSLQQNFPNPFKIQGAGAQTLIEYQLQEPGLVNLTIFNALGQAIKVLVNVFQEAGHYSLAWDGRDQRQKKVKSGIYFYRLEAKGFSRVRKMMVLR